MTFLIAAAGTGGHVFPGLSVGEGLIDLGVARDDIMYVGGDRLESEVYPREGFEFLQVPLAGLQRSLTPKNARIPLVVIKARNRIAEAIEAEYIRVVLGMGGYVTIPTALAARQRRVPFFNAEQNAEAGLANRVVARWAKETFVSFPDTGGLPEASWVGNPVRKVFWDFDRRSLRAMACARYELDPETPVVGVFGGSLGALSINEAVADMLETWPGPPVQLVHLTGESHHEALADRVPGAGVSWRRVPFEEQMDLFYAVCDIVIARAGGAVAELTATATPSILVPGRFGSGGHQEGNARFLEQSGAAVIIEQAELDAELGPTLLDLIQDSERRGEIARAAGAISKPDAARTIARSMIEAAE